MNIESRSQLTMAALPTRSWKWLHSRETTLSRCIANALAQRRAMDAVDLAFERDAVRKELMAIDATMVTPQLAIKQITTSTETAKPKNKTNSATAPATFERVDVLS